MSDFDIGMSKMRQLSNLYDMAKETMKTWRENEKVKEQIENFVNALSQKDPNNPVMDADNTVLYSTEGMGHAKMDKLLTDCNIPHVLVTENATGKTFIAVPAQYQAQTSAMFGMEHSFAAEENTSPEMQGYRGAVGQAARNNPHVSPIGAMAAAKSTTVVFRTPHPQFRFEQELKNEGIPYASFVDGAGQHCVTVAPVERERAERIYQKISERATELSYNDFVRENLGRAVCSQQLTTAQMEEVTRSLEGSSLGYCMSGNQDGSWTLRYREDQTEYIAPVVAAAVAKTGGVRAQSIEDHANNVLATARQAHEMAAQKERFVAGDADDPSHFVTVDNAGMHDAQGQMLVSRNDERFQAMVYEEIHQMKAPLVKKTDKDAHKLENVCTVEEIVKARESAALSNPEDSGMIASQVLTFKMSEATHAPNRTSASVLNAGVDACNKLANAVEEDLNRMNISELAKELGMSKKEVAIIENMTPPQRHEFATELRQTANELAHMGNAIQTHVVSVDELPLEDIGEWLDRGDMDDIAPVRGDQEIGGGAEPEMPVPTFDE